MTALCDNLRPASFFYGAIALRLLGKLGGRNRRFLSEPMLLPQSNSTTWHTHDCFKVRGVHSNGFNFKRKGKKEDEERNGAEGGEGRVILAPLACSYLVFCVFYGMV